jgi:hypothetical protein
MSSMKNLQFFIMMAAMLWGSALLAQTGNVGIGTTTPNPNTALDIKSLDKGLIIPQLPLTATTNKAPITGLQDVAADKGLLVYNTATANDVTPGFYYWDGVKWVRIATTSSEGTSTLVTAGANITVTGNGSTASPYIVSAVIPAATTTSLGTVQLAGDLSGTATAPVVADGAITAAKINQMSATTGQALVWNGTTWTPSTVAANNIYTSNGTITNQKRTV